jgi:hypothetical protein
MHRSYHICQEVLHILFTIVNFTPHQVECLKDAGLMDLAREMSRQGRISSGELAAEPARYLMCTRASKGVTKLFDKVGAEHVALVWSMWSGYWERPGCALRAWAERVGASGVTTEFVHSGGHAWPEDLERLASAIGAKKTVWVHTDATPSTSTTSTPRGILIATPD